MTKFCKRCGRIIRYDGWSKAYICVACGTREEVVPDQRTFTIKRNNILVKQSRSAERELVAKDD
ncbi:MAG: hypothetical protein ACM3WU_07255 [Bacillota bacterium]